MNILLRNIRAITVPTLNNSKGEEYPCYPWVAHKHNQEATIRVIRLKIKKQ